MLLEDIMASHGNIQSSQPHVKAKEEEIAMVEVAYTVVQPRAMMVHLQNTLLTYRAMVSSWWFWRNTLLTNGYHFLKVLRWDSWACEGCHDVIEDDVD
jgi:hypothetical protein